MTVDQALALAAGLAGSRGQLCKELGVTRQAMNRWQKKGVPIARAIQIQTITQGVVKLGDLCPEYAGIEIVENV
jgi:DNA-binding transcriptional regulator YdaS (Cro superfamily)